MRQQLGQHFLINRRIIEKIVRNLDLKGGDVVLEVGAGHGELTDELRRKNYELRITAIEKDKRLAGVLKNKFKRATNIKIIEGDALKILPNLTTHHKLPTTHYKIVGNIPYYITGKLLRVLGEIKNKPEFIVLMMQKEVAERICAKPPKMNLLAASVQFWAEPKILFNVPKENFEPRPEIDSAVISLKPYKTQEKNSEKFYQLIKTLFKQPRKTILNNLRAGFSSGGLARSLKELRIDPESRPQDLELEQIKTLSKKLL